MRGACTSDPAPPLAGARVHRLRRLYGRLGATCWILIVPAKLLRHVDREIADAVVDAAPSLLGPAGLLLVLLSSEGRLALMTIPQASLAAAGIALAVEFAQLIPMVRPLYRFDRLDVAATLLGVASAGLLAAALRRWVTAR